jgi:hypothetical protein
LRGVWRDVSTSHAGGVGGARPARVGGGARLRPAQPSAEDVWRDRPWLAAVALLALLLLGGALAASDPTLTTAPVRAPV